MHRGAIGTMYLMRLSPTTRCRAGPARPGEVWSVGVGGAVAGGGLGGRWLRVQERQARVGAVWLRRAVGPSHGVDVEAGIGGRCQSRRQPSGEAENKPLRVGGRDEGEDAT